MLFFLVKRVLQNLAILVGVAFLLFFLFNVSGGDPSSIIAGKYGSEIDIDLASKSLGTDRPFLIQLGAFLSEIANFNFGRSWATQDVVNTSIFERLRPTLLLMLPGFLFSFIFSLFVGAWPYVSGKRHLTSSIIGMASVVSSLSSLVVIIVAQYFFTYKLVIFSSMGWPESLMGQLNFLVLPWLIILIIGSGSQIIWMASIFGSTYRKTFIRTARASGQSPWKVFLGHALPASSPILAVSFMYQVAFTVTGSILIESYFSIPGVGSLIASAIRNADLPVLKATTIYGTLIYLFCSLVSDLLQFKLDPKAQLK